MSQSRPLDGGLDVPKEALAVAYGAHDQDAEVISLGTVGTRQGALDTLLRHLRSKSTQLVFVYEAGPCGSWLYRYLTNQGTGSPADGSRQKRQAGRGRHGSSLECLHGGDGPARSCTPESQGLIAAQAPRGRTSIGRGAAPGWGNPRQREEAARYARP